MLKYSTYITKQLNESKKTTYNNYKLDFPNLQKNKRIYCSDDRSIQSHKLALILRSFIWAGIRIFTLIKFIF
jgi:hypothetical protein